jgi:hypothetical protein
MHLETLRHVHRALRPGNTLRQWLNDRFSEVLIFGVPAVYGANEALQAITDGAIRGVTLEGFQTVRYSLPYEARELCAQLAGQSMFSAQEHAAPVLDPETGCTRVQTILAANEHPMFVRLKAPTHDVFLLAGRMPDLDKPLNRDTGLGDDCILLLSPMIFLRKCFPESCWRGDEATARLIIDDPLLTKKYGALDFEILKRSMQRLGYGTSIAFIPWNYWRMSRRSTASLLSEDSNLTICIHGCDHTNREFASGGADALAKKAALGIWRMQEHRRRVGVAFEDVMVFPQGQFSRDAIPALRSANYLAVVNTTCFPTDCAPDELKVADFLQPAVTRFDGFPVFQRRYPRDLFGFAFDLFLGKPALIVEHHEYFRDNCKAIEQFVAELQQIEPCLSWPSLTTLLMRSSLRRRLDNSCAEVRFFTRRFQFVPQEGEHHRCVLSKPEFDSSPIKNVLVDGKSVSFGLENELLKFEVEAEGRPKTIEIIDQTPSPTIRSFGVAHNIRVLIRRGLSEFRDNTLSHHSGALRIAKKVVETIKATGDS